MNTKPLEIDLLVVKKNASVNISNEIGKLLMSDEIKADDVTVSIMREARPDGLQGYSMSNPYKGVGRGKPYLAQSVIGEIKEGRYTKFAGGGK